MFDLFKLEIGSSSSFPVFLFLSFSLESCWSSDFLFFSFFSFLEFDFFFSFNFSFSSFSSSSLGIKETTASLVKGLLQTRQASAGHSRRALSEKTCPQVLITENLKILGFIQYENYLCFPVTKRPVIGHIKGDSVAGSSTTSLIFS